MASGIETLLVIFFILIPTGIFTGVVFVTRWVARRRAESRAQCWLKVDATVHGSFELDENSAVGSPGGWDRFEEFSDKDHKQEYVAQWTMAIQYIYRVSGEIYTGAYFLPSTSPDGHLATEAGRTWIGRKIVIRSNPARPDQSFFLVEDGAPGKPHIPTLASDKPWLTTLSLK